MRALITGVTGQDGHYLAPFLLGLGYEVFGLVRRTSSPPRVSAGVKVVEGDLLDSRSLERAFRMVQPDEVYNLAAQSHVGTSFEQPNLTRNINNHGACEVFYQTFKYRPDAKVYQASTSEMFGGDHTGYLNEASDFNPKSPYAEAKVAAHEEAVRMRSRGRFICCGILFNHESPFRGENFVTRKITRAVGRIKAGLQDELVLGNLAARRDWGFAGDYVRAMWAMLQRDESKDYVIGTGISHTVEDLVHVAFRLAGLNWRDHVTTSDTEHRPNEVPSLCADPYKAEVDLNWHPQIEFNQLIQIMVEHDIQLAKKEAACL